MFLLTRFFDVISNRGKKRIDLMVVEEMATTVQEESNGSVKPCSAQGIARILDRPVSTVHKVLLNFLHCYPYKIRNMQELFPSDLPAREIFALKFFAQIEVDNECPW